MAKGKYHRAFKVNGQMIRLANGETKEDVLETVDLGMKMLEIVKGNDAKREYVINSLEGTARSVLRAKGLI
tara:strand:- start:109 stop:321 length:213 start_codon:yes stop_codon:yes gene_type:complete